MLVVGLWLPFYKLLPKNSLTHWEPVFLPDKFGWGGGLIIALASLFAFYIFLKWMDRKGKPKMCKG